MSLKLKNLILQLLISKALYISLSYVGCTSRHLHQRVEQHKRSVVGNHVSEQHGNEPREITKNVRVLRKCSNKFDCLIFEMLFIRDLRPKLNKQSDPSAHSCLFNTFNSFLILFTSYLYFIFAFRYFIIRLFYPWTWTWKWPWSGRNIVLISYHFFLQKNVLLRTYYFVKK